MLNFPPKIRKIDFSKIFGIFDFSRKKKIQKIFEISSFSKIPKNIFSGKKFSNFFSTRKKYFSKKFFRSQEKVFDFFSMKFFLAPKLYQTAVPEQVFPLISRRGVYACRGAVKKVGAWQILFSKLSGGSFKNPKNFSRLRRDSSLFPNFLPIFFQLLSFSKNLRNFHTHVLRWGGFLTLIARQSQKTNRAT